MSEFIGDLLNKNKRQYPYTGIVKKKLKKQYFVVFVYGKRT